MSDLRRDRASSLIPESMELSDGSGGGAIMSPASSAESRSSWLGSLHLHPPKVKVKLPALKEVTWGMLWHNTKEFLSDPVNLALVAWMLLSVPACVLIMAIKLGLLNSVLDAEQREHVDEVATQVVNALFALTCLIIFPMLCRHTFLLCRWSPKDKLELRQAFCKNGKRKPHDRTHMAMVVLWAQITCWATFAFAAVYWLFPLGSRPTWLVSSTFVVSMVAPVISFVYLLVSPLSRDYDIVKEGDDSMLRMYQHSTAFYQGDREVKEAQWNGTVVPGCCDDRKVACLVCWLPCCMFGFNMERLGFGHRAVHTLAFVVVLIGPVLVFELSSEAVYHMGHAQRIVYYSGVLLALLGTAYGGAWRIKMRETYHLPGSAACCGSTRATDVCTWVCCSYCALCQEIRTTEQYHVESSACRYTQAPGGEGRDPEVVPAEGDEDVIMLGKTSPPGVFSMQASPRAELAM